jgi:hypothetical protein
VKGITGQSMIAGLVTSIAIMSGCAQPSKPDAMVIHVVGPVHKTEADVSVAVSGGKETSKMGASQISDDAFATALRGSIEEAGLFRKVSTEGARYRLTGFIGKVDQPMMGFSMTVKMEVSYSLKDMQSGTTVWTKDIESEYTAKASAAFAGVERLRLANEGAARDNIRQVVTDLEALTL